MSGKSRAGATLTSEASTIAGNMQASSKVGLYARLSTRLALMPKPVQVTLAAGVFAAGWKIGSGIRSLWVETDIPEAPSAIPAAYSSARLKLWDTTVGGGYWNGVSEYDGTGTGEHSLAWTTGPEYQYEFLNGGTWFAAIRYPAQSNWATANGYSIGGTCSTLGSGYSALVASITDVVERGNNDWQRPGDGCAVRVLQPTNADDNLPVTSVAPYAGETVPSGHDLTEGGSPSAPSISDAEMDDFFDDPDNEDAADEIDEWLGAPPSGSFEIPAPDAHETYDAYIGRLESLGYVGTATEVELTTDTLDPHRDAGEVVRTTPAAGTVIAPDADVTVKVNPDDAPPATEGGEGLPSSGGSCTPWTSTSIDLSPLEVELPDTFPFGVPFWIASALDNWVGDPETPEWDFHFPFAGDGDNFTVSLAMFDSSMPAIRAVLLAVSIISLAWLFMSAALGFGAGRKED